MMLDAIMVAVKNASRCPFPPEDLPRPSVGGVIFPDFRQEGTRPHAVPRPSCHDMTLVACEVEAS
jgi:hypothetical protein